MVVAFEQIWMIRNRVWKGEGIPNWLEFTKKINKVFAEYWRSALLKISCNSGPNYRCLDVQWHPSPFGEYKFNFDATFKNGQTTIGVVLHNSDGC